MSTAVANVQPRSVLIDKRRSLLIARNRARGRGFDQSWIGEPNSGCWLWTGALTRKGYGHMCLASGKTMTAHRRSWQLHYGEIPPGMHVLHRCDVRCCVNPDHLFLGTNQDNTDDKVRKGRQGRMHGEKNHQAKLTEIDVRTILSMGGSNIAIGRIFGVSNVLISRIRQRKAWRHVQ
jgi:hypothetical protein